jgi:hypothetical protein
VPPSFSVYFLQRLRLPGLLIVAYLSLGSAIEVLVGSWPLHIYDLNWRLSALNSAAGATGTELLALLLLLVIAQVSMSVTGLWTGFWASAVLALFYLVATTIFGLDSLEVRGRVSAAQLHRFDVTVVWTLARFGFAQFVCSTLAARALRAARVMRRESPRDTANRLVVGTSALTPAGAARSVSRPRATTSYGESVGS